LLIFGSVYTRKPKTFQNGLQVDYDPGRSRLRQAAYLAPYTSTTTPLPVYPVASAHGCELHLASGEALVDGMSSWWAAIHGYNHPRLNAAMKTQIDQMSHVMFGGITHQPAVDLCRRLVAMTPGVRVPGGFRLRGR
jgi:adenosylmethionine-8-amino-7-oxononanoate aminotransferase